MSYTRKMSHIKRLSVFGFIITTGVFSVFSSANATIYAIDNFSITKNGSSFFNDPFTDGNPPPSSEGLLPTGAAGEYLTVGTPSESNGKVFLDTAFGEAGSSPLNGLPVSTHRSRLKTNIDPANLAAGLKSDDTLKVTGLFDFVLPEVGERYGIRLADWDAPPDGPAGRVDVVELVLERDISGDVMARFAKYNFGLGTRDIITLWNLTDDFAFNGLDLNDFDQIEFNLEKPNAFSPSISGFFNVYDYDAPNTLNYATGNVVDIFTEYNYTRAEFIAIRVGSVPEPATMLLMGMGLAGLGFSRRRKV